MKVHTVRILDTAIADVGDIADYIVFLNTRPNMRGSCRLRLCR